VLTVRERNRTDLPHEVYPRDEWALLEEAFSPRFLYLTETIFSLSNGTIGVRGTLDEGDPAHIHGTFINGLHETWPIIHPESAYGFAKTGQTIVNVPDATAIEVLVDGETFRCTEGGVEARRRLDFNTGVLTREASWVSTSGVGVHLLFRRLVSLREPELVAFDVSVEVDRDAHIELISRLVNRQDLEHDQPDETADPRKGAALQHRVLEPRAATVDGARLVQGWVTSNSRMGLITGMDHRVTHDDVRIFLNRRSDDFAVHFDLHLDAGQTVQLFKAVTYHATNGEDDVDDHRVANRTLDTAIEMRMEGLIDAQRKELEQLWDAADIDVGAQIDVQRAARWNLFQLLQASATLRNTSVPAKGLTGQAYDGHYFWDVEIYILPFLIYTNPLKAAEILRFRHRLLDQARERATELSHRGALFPWRTINGEEASAYFLAGTAQYHIDADIIYALRKYVEVTGDDGLLWDIGVELAVETARLWVDVGFYRAGRFHIHGVTGPDEYSALVHDNAFTNSMARMNLRFAADCVQRMKEEQPNLYEKLVEDISLTEAEVTDWRLAADAMYVPYDFDLGITPQDENFLSNEPWDFERTPPSKYPMLLHFHPLVIYRHQVLKQADVVLADFLLGDEFSFELKKANFDYYDPITTGDSSLSASVEAIMAAEIGYADRAYQHFEHALFMDLADLAGNTTDGVHMASTGGVWMALVYGFGGLRDYRGELSFDPRLPRDWHHLAFRLRYRQSTIEVRVEHEELQLRLSGEPIEVSVRGQRVLLRPGEQKGIPLETPGDQDSGSITRLSNSSFGS